MLRALAAIIVLLALAAAIVHVASERRLQREYAIDPRLHAPDPSLLDEGSRLARSRGCADCHGDDFGGRVIADEMPFARLVGPALVRSDARESAQDVHRRLYLALHHGVDPGGRPLLMMPSLEFSNLSKHEIEALSAFFASLPPIVHDIWYVGVSEGRPLWEQKPDWAAIPSTCRCTASSGT